MTPFSPPAATARLTVDLDALQANYAVLAAAAQGAEVAPAVKADAYGLGAAEVAPALREAGARSFFAARVDEGAALRAVLGPEPAIFVLDGCAPGAAERLESAGLIPVLNSPAQIEAWRERAAGSRRRLPAALHFDTGMNRLGLRADEAQALAVQPHRLAGLEIVHVMSHLACGSEPDHPMNARQCGRFSELRDHFPEARASLAASAGVLLGEAYRFDMVRPGIALYGGGPFEHPDPSLRAVATLEAQVLQIRRVGPGETVGYGGTWRAEAPVRVGVLGIGYADGLPRSASSPNGAVFAEGGLRPLVGRVSMDVCAFDASDCARLAPGDFVEVFGPNRLLDDAAAAAGTLAYELLTGVGPRVVRHYARRVD